MSKVQYALKNVNVLNMILVAISVGLYFLWVHPLLDTDIKVNMPRVEEAAVRQDSNDAAVEDFDIIAYFDLARDDYFLPFIIFETRIDPPQSGGVQTAKQETVVVAENMPTALDYIIVTEKNLFHSERRAPSENAATQISRPEIIFYGAVITGETRIAYIEDVRNPYATPGRGKRQTPVVQGAMIGGYKLTEVNPESLVLVRGDDKMVVNLRDQKDRKDAGTTTGKQLPSAAAKPQTPSAPQMPVMPQMPVFQPTGPGPAPPSHRSAGPGFPLPTGR
ncbi:MAG: hypothetical protein PHQ63_03605 [Smithellaceae bacterium]|nr:hypothetical protein [Smithellaceae bacterium]